MTDADLRASRLAKLRGLMAKTVENGCTEAEARSAAEAVDRLLAAYEIDLTEVLARQQEILQASVDHALHDVKFACGQIAKFLDCKVWVNGKKIVYLGFKIDTEIAEYLTLMFKRAIDREFATFILFNLDYDAKRPAERVEMQRCFGTGMAIRLGDRLRELKSKRDFTARTGGRDLVAIKMPLVEEEFAKLGMQLIKGTNRRKYRDQAAYHAGTSAAERVSITAGVASRAQAGGRLA